jgi:hypothetical protein
VYNLVVDDSASGDWVFDVMTPLGFRVQVSRARWDLIVSIKHPAMAGQESEV